MIRIIMIVACGCADGRARCRCGQASAQNNTLGGAIIGGGIGAIIGGAATGRAGGAIAGGIIGAAAGAALGSQTRAAAARLLLVQRPLLGSGTATAAITACRAATAIESCRKRKRAASRPPSLNATREEPRNGSAPARRPT